MLPLQATTAGSVMLLLTALAPLGARAQGAAEPATPEVPAASELRIAAERFDEGRDAYKAGAFAEAAEHFEAADRRAPSASALGLAMRSRDEAGQLLRAANLAELALARYPDDAELTERAKEIISSAVSSGARVHIGCEPACDMVVDRRLSHGGLQSNWVLYLEPGPHVLSANFSGRGVVSKEVQVEVGETTEYAFQPPKPTVEMPPRVAPAPPVLPPRRAPVEVQKRLSPTWFWIGVGVTSALTAATIWSGIDAQNNPGPDAVRRECVGQGESCPLYQQGQRAELRTNVLIGVTAASAVATVALGALFTDFSVVRASPQVGHGNTARLRPWFDVPATPGGSWSGALLGAEGRF